MTQKTKSTTDVPAFAMALQKVLAVSQFDARRSCQPPPGYWHGPVRDLFSDLQMEAGSWIHNVHDRPHEISELRRDLKKHAVELHRDHCIIVSLEGRVVSLMLRKKP